MIQCLLEVFYLSEVSTSSLSYNALSYVWGSEPFFDAISCNGKPLNVTLSLSETLRQLFLYDKRDPQRRPIWIDAICLNQQNLTEIKVRCL